MPITTTNGTTVSDEVAGAWGKLDGAQFRAAVGYLAGKGYGPVEYRRRVAAYAEVRRQLRGTAKPKASSVAVAATPKVKLSMGDAIHARHVAKGLPASVGTKRDGTPKAHCFGCFVNERVAATA